MTVANTAIGNADLARGLLVSTATHVAAHIDNHRNKLAYMRAATRCWQLCSDIESGINLDLMKYKLFALRYNVSVHFKKRWFNREAEYYAMGIQHAIEVIDSIFVRFETGYSHSNELLHLSILEGTINEHQVCACLERFSQIKR